MVDYIGYIGAAAIAVGVGLLLFVIIASIPSSKAVAEVVSADAAGSRVRDPGERRTFAELLADVMPSGYTGWIQRKILYAGRGGDWTVGGFLLLKTVLTAFGLLIVIWAIAASGSGVLVFLSILLTILLFVVPDGFLAGRASERQKSIELALPDILDQMTIAVEAGLGFEAAMTKTAQAGATPLNDELIRTLQDMSIGRSRADAYEALLARTDCEDLRRFIRAILQADRYGISVADVLRVQAGEMRLRRRQRAEEQAMKVPVKVIFPLVFCILPVLFIVLLYPAAVSIVGVFAR
ncbi:type II secretion system F family protein [Agromyces sp. SYSU T00194]|uniref:type II secretion system F family protein n=1 Tax=Agromyces chitinivorans TaxID=3158560 RepID=UPI00339AD450